MFANSDRKDERLRGPKFMVYWQGRTMLADRSLFNAVVKTASSEGLGFEMEQAVSKGKFLNIEFFITFRGKETRLRAKLKVIYCMILSSNRGVYMEARILDMADGDRHTYNNVLQALGDAKEMDLRI